MHSKMNDFHRIAHRFCITKNVHNEYYHQILLKMKKKSTGTELKIYFIDFIRN